MANKEENFKIEVCLVPPEEGGEIRNIFFEEDIELVLRLTALGRNLYRLEQTPVWVDVQAFRGDIIEAEALDNGVLHFRRVVTPSLWSHWDRLLPQKVVESSAFAAFKEAIEAVGGVWEQYFGGIFLVHLPPGSPFDPEVALEMVDAQLKKEENGAS